MSYVWEIKHAIEKNNLNNVDIEKVIGAYEFAKEAHRGQRRKSGEDYIMHPVEVAKILIEMKMDTDTIVAAILHDIVEDTLIQPADIIENFGETVCRLVEGVTKLKKLPEGSQKQVENIRKMIVAMAKDIRVVIIKLADRLHNMRTLKYMPDDKRTRIAEETLKIFAPIAHRLGMSKIKQELEDLCLFYLKPDIYRQIAELINGKRREREDYTDNIINELNAELKKYDFHAEVTGRAKHFYSIYKKMYEKNKTFDDIYDLIAIRVITQSDVECYNVLGIVHNLWTPIPGRFKDYIAVPKSNGYQSIHTTILGEGGNFVEIQIRTQDMHSIAEDGIAAHWKYKEGIKKANTSSENIYSWLKKILEWQSESESSEEFISAVTGDIFSEEVFVFSPKGEVVELPAGATPLDFAFFIHTQVGFKCIGAKINGKIVPIDYKLNNGDRVEIITSKTAKGPGRDWIKIVVTNGAKSKIRKWFKEQEYEQKIKEGKSLLEKEIITANPKFKDKEIDETPEIIEFMKKHNIPDYNELLFNIATGSITINQILFKIKKEEKVITPENLIEHKKVSRKKNDFGIVIAGIDNTVIRFAKCCTPMPGDPIAGYVSRGKGVTIHRSDCKNYLELLKKDRERIIDVRWDEQVEIKNSYDFTFNVLVEDRQNILIDLMKIISEAKINITSVNSLSFFSQGMKMTNIKFSIEIREKEQYSRIVASLKKLNEVVEIKRI